MKRARGPDPGIVGLGGFRKRGLAWEIVDRLEPGVNFPSGEGPSPSPSSSWMRWWRKQMPYARTRSVGSTMRPHTSRSARGTRRSNSTPPPNPFSFIPLFQNRSGRVRLLQQKQRSIHKSRTRSCGRCFPDNLPTAHDRRPCWRTPRFYWNMRNLASWRRKGSWRGHGE
jgi:hypothetical protein